MSAEDKTTRPKRIQLSRAKGWRKPAGAVVVARPTKWGNPWRARQARPFWEVTLGCGTVAKDTDRDARQFAVEAFRDICTSNRTGDAIWIAGHCCILHEIRGRDLACWCPLDQPCHADVLLEIANA